MGVTCEEFNAFNCSSLIRTTLMYKLVAVLWTGLMLGFQVWVYAISRKGIEHLGITLVLFSLWTSSLGKKGRAAYNYISGIWISALKMSMQNADWWRWHWQWCHYPWHVFFNVCLHSRLFLLRSPWRKSDSSVDREPQGNWRWNSNSRDIVASSPSFPRPAARAL